MRAYLIFAIFAILAIVSVQGKSSAQCQEKCQGYQSSFNDWCLYLCKKNPNSILPPLAQAEEQNVDLGLIAHEIEKTIAQPTEEQAFTYNPDNYQRCIGVCGKTYRKDPNRNMACTKECLVFNMKRND